MHPQWDTALLEKDLPIGPFGAPLVFRTEVGSTNSLAMELARDGAAPGTLVLAETQSAGRGRQGRVWHSSAGTGIWMSLLVPVPDMPSGDRLCNMAGAVAVTDALRDTAGVDAAIKWPNDVWINGRKVCGILVEAVPDRRIFVTGMGINVNAGADEFPEELRDTATSLALATDRSFRREDVLHAVLERFAGLHAQLAAGDGGTVVKAYAERSFLMGRHVVVGDVDGIATGVREDGALLVRTNAGTETPVVSGEIEF